MNKKKFEKRINFLIKNNVLTTFNLKELIENDKQSLFNNEDVIKLIKENFWLIIRKCVNKPGVIEILYNYEELKEIIENNFMDIFLLFNHHEMYEIISDTDMNFNVIEWINNNFDTILSNCDIQDIYKLYFIHKIFYLVDENFLKLNNNISDNKEIFAEIFLTPILKYNNCGKKDYDSLLNVISMLIDELCENGKVKYTDIKYIGHGAYSNVFLIGDKVLKVGVKRETYEIPNDKRILKPLIRVDLGKYSDVEGTIEVSNKVNTEIYLNEEELYNLYKELRDRGIIVTDLRNVNLGYLLEDNNYNWDKEISNDLIARGFKNNEDLSEVLKKGDVVIIDTDFIFNEGDDNIKYTSGSSDYEERYKKEMNYIEQLDLESNVDLELSLQQIISNEMETEKIDEVMEHTIKK